MRTIGSPFSCRVVHLLYRASLRIDTLFGENYQFRGASNALEQVISRMLCLKNGGGAAKTPLFPTIFGRYSYPQAVSLDYNMRYKK
jgi:hypothetical protein